MHQHETKTIKYLPPEKCFSREHEVKYAKPAKSLQVEGGTIALKDGTSIPSETIFTSLHFQKALTRRAIAYEFAQLISFDVSRRYCDMLIKHLGREHPPGYSATTLAQLIKADQQVWAKLAEAGSDIRRNNAGELPLDKLLISSLESYEISFYLLPMVTPNQGSSWKSSRVSPYDDNPKGPKLRGGRPTNQAGNPICFNYNLEGCDAAQPGSACPRGLHICCKCFKHTHSPGITSLKAKVPNPDSRDLALWNINHCMRPFLSKYSLALAVSLHG